MPWNLFSQVNSKRPKLIVASTALYILIVIISIFIFFAYKIDQNKNIERVTAAARKNNPNAEARDIVVAKGFASAIVSDPTSKGQANSGNLTFFKENKDKSMTQIADGSSFSPLDLLNLGIPLETQANLNNIGIDQVKQNLANYCSYNGGNRPGYSGFEGSFKPNGWQIDANKMFYIKQALDEHVAGKNSNLKDDEKIICINAMIKNSDQVVNVKLSSVKYVIQLQFITYNGELSTHKFSFELNRNNIWTFILDGREIYKS